MANVTDESNNGVQPILADEALSDAAQTEPMVTAAGSASTSAETTGATADGTMREGVEPGVPGQDSEKLSGEGEGTPSVNADEPQLDEGDGGDGGEEDEEVEIEPLTEDQEFRHALRHLVETFSLRQGEIIRLAEYVRDQASEIDDAKARAKRLLEQRLSEVNDDALDTVWGWLDEELSADDKADGDKLSEAERRDAVRTAIAELAESVPKGAIGSYLESVSRALSAPPAVGTMFSSLLVALVGELEMFVATLSRILFQRRPEALEDSGQQFSWDEISRHDDMESFKDFVVGRSIEKLLRGSLEDWLSFFERRFDIQTPKFARSFSAMELMQRRHVIVHNGGYVSRQYLEKLATFSHKAKLDQHLSVDFDYLTRAADDLFVVAVGLSTAAGFKICSESDVREAMEYDFGNRCFYLLQEQRYELVRVLVEYGDVRRMKSEAAALITRVNGWIAMKKLGRFKECVAEVEQFDVSTRSNNYVLAKYALLDKVEEAHRLAQKMLADEELPHEFWLTWPLLEDVREYERNLGKT
jgi:hypothetical protein